MILAIMIINQSNNEKVCPDIIFLAE